MTGKQFLQLQGYEFEPDEFWGDEYISNDHKWEDITKLMEEYAKVFHMKFKAWVEEIVMKGGNRMEDLKMFKNSDLLNIFLDECRAERTSE